MSEPIEVANLMVNPKPTGTRGWNRFGDVEVRMMADGTGIFCRNISGGGNRGIDYALPDLPAGNYVYGFVMSSSAYEAGDTIALIKTGPTTYGSTVRFAETAGEHAYTGEFAITKPGVNWLFTPPKAAKGAMSVKRFLLCTKEDWQIMQENNVQWFDGDSFLTGGGFPLTACIHMWICALWWWSHEQAHHPTRRTAGHGLQKLCVHAVPGPAYDRQDHVHARLGRRRATDRSQAQPVRSGAHLQHGDAPEMLSDERHAGCANHHASTVQHGHPHRSAGQMGRQSAGIDLQHGCRFIRTAPVGAHAHERNGRDHAIQTPIGYRLEPLVSRLTLVPGLGVAA